MWRRWLQRFCIVPDQTAVRHTLTDGITPDDSPAKDSEVYDSEEEVHGGKRAAFKSSSIGGSSAPPAFKAVARKAVKDESSCQKRHNSAINSSMCDPSLSESAQAVNDSRRQQFTNSAFAAAQPAGSGDPELFDVLKINIGNMHDFQGCTSMSHDGAILRPAASAPATAAAAAPRPFQALTRHVSSLSLRSLASANSQIDECSSTTSTLQRQASLLQASFVKRAGSSSVSSGSALSAQTSINRTNSSAALSEVASSQPSFDGKHQASSALPAAVRNSSSKPGGTLAAGQGTGPREVAQSFASCFMSAIKDRNVKWASETSLSTLLDDSAKLKTHNKQIFVGKTAIIRRLNGGMEQLAKLIESNVSEKDLMELGNKPEFVTVEVQAAASSKAGAQQHRQGNVTASYTFKLGMRKFVFKDHFKVRNGKIRRLKRVRG